MNNQDWLIVRAIRLAAFGQEATVQLLMELSRSVDNVTTAERIWETATQLQANAQALESVMAELQSGIICRIQCPQRDGQLTKEKLTLCT